MPAYYYVSLPRVLSQLAAPLPHFFSAVLTSNLSRHLTRFAASKACLDLLNENMTLLPDDAELALGGGGAGCGGWRPRSQPATATAASLHV